LAGLLVPTITITSAMGLENAASPTSSRFFPLSDACLKNQGCFSTYIDEESIDAVGGGRAETPTWALGGGYWQRPGKGVARSISSSRGL